MEFLYGETSVIVRHIDEDGLEQLKKIHERFYGEEFPFPDFGNNFLSTFCVVDNNNVVITGGGIRTILESIIITDKDRNPVDRKDALYSMLAASLYCVEKLGYDQLHAFVQDKVWLNRLKRVGFTETKGQALVIGI